MTKANKQHWAITLFTIGVFMAALDNGIISAALTTINSSFDVSPSWGAWGITLYTLGLAVSVPIVGKLSDRYGRKKLFIVEVVLFGIGSLLVAVSQSFPMFLISRLIQALGGGGIFIIGSAHILTTLPREKQGKALGILGGVNGIAAVLGPNIGSFLLDLTGSWHWLFLINIPIAIALTILGFLFIVETKGSTSKPLDFVGTVILSVAILGIMLGITNIDSSDTLNSLKDPSFYGFIAAGISFFIVLFFYEKRLEEKGGDPILAYSVLKQRAFQWTLIIGLLSGGLLAAVIFIPAYVELSLGVPAAKAGYWMTPLALASGIGAGLGGAFVDRKGPIVTVVISGIIAFIGFILFPIWVTEKWQFLVASSIAGVGFGFLLGAPLNVLASESARGQEGSAIGTLSLVRQIGLTIAPTIYASFITAGTKLIGTNLSNKLTEANISIPEANHDIPSDPAALQQQLELIPNADVQAIIMNTIQETMRTAFGNLYLTSAIISVLILVSVLFLKKARNSGL